MHSTGQTAAHGASVQCMQAIDTERSPGFPSFMVTTRRRLMPHGTSCSFLQAVTQALHSMQRSASQRNLTRAIFILPSRRLDLAQGHLTLVHTCHGIVTVARDRVCAFAKHDRIIALRVFTALIDTLEPAAKVEWHKRHAFADTISDESLDPRLRTVFRTEHPDPAAILDAAISGVRRVDLDEHVLPQLGKPAVRSRFLTAAFVFDQASGGQDDRELLGKSLVHRGLLDREAEIGHSELAAIGASRIFGHEFRT